MKVGEMPADVDGAEIEHLAFNSIDISLWGAPVGVAALVFQFRQNAAGGLLSFAREVSANDGGVDGNGSGVVDFVSRAR